MSRLYNWHRGVGSHVTVNKPRYNERALLASEDLVIGATKTVLGYDPIRPVPGSRPAQRTEAIRAIAYDAKGQCERIEYGNEAITCYDYDPQTFRLKQLRTTRAGYDPDFPGHRS